MKISTDNRYDSDQTVIPRLVITKDPDTSGRLPAATYFVDALGPFLKQLGICEVEVEQVHWEDFCEV